MQSEINVTPLVDVCLVLLIIFMVVTPMMTGVPVQLPKTGTSESLPNAKRLLPITVKADGTLYVDAIALRREQLQSEIVRIHSESADRPIVVRADKSVAYGAVLEVLDTCRTVGFRDVGLASDLKAAP
jgi:biopolymer transport protein ExbD